MAFKPNQSAHAVTLLLRTVLITDFEVMIRPFNGLQALGAEMGARLGHLLPASKSRRVGQTCELGLPLGHALLILGARFSGDSTHAGGGNLRDARHR
jgi:hypothetical protein